MYLEALWMQIIATKLLLVLTARLIPFIFPRMATVELWFDGCLSLWTSKYFLVKCEHNLIQLFSPVAVYKCTLQCSQLEMWRTTACICAEDLGHEAKRVCELKKCLQQVEDMRLFDNFTVHTFNIYTSKSKTEKKNMKQQCNAYQQPYCVGINVP